jgi:hypothetical protein
VCACKRCQWQTIFTNAVVLGAWEMDWKQLAPPCDSSSFKN